MLTCAISMAPHNEGKDGLKLYVAQPEGPLHAVDADSGRPLWPMPFGAAVKGGSHAGVVQAHTMPGLSTSNRCGKTLPEQHLGNSGTLLGPATSPTHPWQCLRRSPNVFLWLCMQASKLVPRH